MILKMAFIVFWSSLIGFTLLLYSVDFSRIHIQRHSKKTYYWYEPNLRFWKNNIYRFWHEHGARAFARGFVLVSSHIRSFLYRALRSVQSWLLRLIQYVEHHEERSRNALHKKPSPKESSIIETPSFSTIKTEKSKRISN